MLDAASTFYADLYTPDPVDNDAIDSLLNTLPDSLRLSTAAHDLLSATIDFDDIIAGVSRCPRSIIPNVVKSLLLSTMMPCPGVFFLILGPILAYLCYRRKAHSQI
ncbi:hypothetical protein G6F46_014929 [Rhizopus delemar]|nr:hypothetical protein G6F46_014929 [Rhizopus delemar]